MYRVEKIPPPNSEARNDVWAGPFELAVFRVLWRRCDDVSANVSCC